MGDDGRVSSASGFWNRPTPAMTPPGLRTPLSTLMTSSSPAANSRTFQHTIASNTPTPPSRTTPTSSHQNTPPYSCRLPPPLSRHTAAGMSRLRLTHPARIAAWLPNSSTRASDWVGEVGLKARREERIEATSSSVVVTQGVGGEVMGVVMVVGV